MCFSKLVGDYNIKRNLFITILTAIVLVEVVVDLSWNDSLIIITMTIIINLQYFINKFNLAFGYIKKKKSLKIYKMK